MSDVIYCTEEFAKLPLCAKVDSRRSANATGNRKVIAEAVVDNDEFTHGVLARFSWHLNRKGYPVANSKGSDGKWRTVSLHRLRYEHEHGPVPSGMEIDHIDRNKLNGTSANLRAVSRSVNTANQRTRQDNASGFKGVSCRKDSISGQRYWLAQLERKRKAIVQKLFPYTETGWRDAARLINDKYRLYFPQVAAPNPDCEVKTYPFMGGN